MKVNIIYILQKKHKDDKEWQTCWGCHGMLGNDKRLSEIEAKCFTKESIGWKFRARPFVELHPLKKWGVL
jgi:hypothetical protein